MKLGYLTPLTPETIANARRLGYDALEVGAGWLPNPGLNQLEESLPALRDALQEAKIAVTSVALYGGTIELPLQEALGYYERAMQLARALGCNVISAMTGRDNSLTVDENLPLFKEYFEPITRMAEDQGIRIAFEPWPGSVVGHGPYRWSNMATTPELWDRLFEAVPSPALGLEYDASHLVWQGIDYLQAIRDYAPRIYHVHAKDIVIDREALKRRGVHGRGWWWFVIPGLGVVDWPALFDTLRQVGYRGDMAVEHEDNEYMGDRWNEGLSLALKTLRPLIDGYRVSAR
jgi:sugar phosphate isomerase/epimerase